MVSRLTGSSVYCLTDLRCSARRSRLSSELLVICCAWVHDRFIIIAAKIRSFFITSRLNSGAKLRINFQSCVAVRLKMCCYTLISIPKHTICSVFHLYLRKTHYKAASKPTDKSTTSFHGCSRFVREPFRVVFSVQWYQYLDSDYPPNTQQTSYNPWGRKPLVFFIHSFSWISKSHLTFFLLFLFYLLSFVESHAAA